MRCRLLVGVSLLSIAAAAAGGSPWWDSRAVNSSPLLEGNFKSQDICRLSIRNGRLELENLLPADKADGADRRIAVQDMPGTTVVCYRPVANATEENPFIFSFEHRSASWPIHSYGRIDWRKDNGLVVCEIIHASPYKYRTITIEQRPGDAAEFKANHETAGVALKVLIVEPPHGLLRRSHEDQVVCTFAAPDMDTLRREHPLEFYQNLIPVFARFGQEEAIAPDLAMGQEIFGKMVADDAKLTADIKKLVGDLDDDAFAVREKALRELEKRGRFAAAVVAQMDRQQLSAQQRVLIDKLAGDAAPLPPATAGKLRDDQGFLCDCMYSGEETVRAAALKQLEAVSKRKIEIDVRAALPERRKAIESLRAELLAATTRPTTQPDAAGAER